jgi:hypothetical protein
MPMTTFCRLAVAATLLIGCEDSGQRGTLVTIAPGASLCDSLVEVMRHASQRFRSLRTRDYATTLESFRASITVTKFDTCWVDDTQARYWCLRREASSADVVKRAEELRGDVAACFTMFSPSRVFEDADDSTDRDTATWALPGERFVRLVERRARPGRQAPSSVVLYVY